MIVRKAYMLGITTFSRTMPEISFKAKLYNEQRDAKFSASDKFPSMHKLLSGSEHDEKENDPNNLAENINLQQVQFTHV
jgi:hypothetical protein